MPLTKRGRTDAAQYATYIKRRLLDRVGYHYRSYGPSGSWDESRYGYLGSVRLGLHQHRITRSKLDKLAADACADMIHFESVIWPGGLSFKDMEISVTGEDNCMTFFWNAPAFRISPDNYVPSPEFGTDQI